MADTLVSFASGATAGSGTVVRVGTDASGTVVIVDETPFHPVDHSWPDQPGDTGFCGEAVVVDTVMAASSPDGGLVLGADIPAKRGEPGWSWYVAHRLAAGVSGPALGQAVDLQVDAARRRALSAAHTACHLAALAMNGATAHLWRKPTREDGLGAPDLDQLAMQTSVMDEKGSTDVYRLGKSLRKKGFDPPAFADELDAIVEAVDEQLAGWVAAGSAVVIDDGGDRRITALRRWTCALPEGRADLPCGGTHVANLGVFDDISVSYDLDPEGTTLTVRTAPRLRPDAAP